MSLINLVDEIVESDVPNTTFVADKGEIDEFGELLRELRETLNMARSEETRCIVRALMVVLQIVHESRLHIREIHARLDDMVSNTKGWFFFFFFLFNF